MSYSVLNDLMHRRPFEPFRIKLSDGSNYEVKHPEMALLLKGGMYIAIPDADDEAPEKANWCSLLHVTAVEPLEAASQK